MIRRLDGVKIGFGRMGIDNMNSTTNSKKMYRKPRVGDYFSISVGDQFVVGRILDFSSKEHPLHWAFNNCYQTILFDKVYSKHEIENFVPKNTLYYHSPEWTNEMGWKKGFFNTIKFDDLVDSDIPNEYCYQDAFGNFYDKIGSRITEPTILCGDWGVASYRLVIKQAEEIVRRHDK